VRNIRALIVVESWFGNTRAVAGAVADGLGQFMTVDVSEVGDAPARVAPDVDLVVVGGPTHAFAMSRPNTRRDAAQQAGVRTGTERGIREWLASSPGGIQRGAAFDTRIDKRWVPGSAVRGILPQLRRLGATRSQVRSRSASRERRVRSPLGSWSEPASGASNWVARDRGDHRHQPRESHAVTGFVRFFV
jgi:hypothetical protein